MTKDELKNELEVKKRDIITQLTEGLNKFELRVFTLKVKNDQLQKENCDLNKTCSQLECDAGSAT